MTITLYTTAAKELLQYAAQIESEANNAQCAWIILGQFDKYAHVMATARALRNAADADSVAIRREILRNAGITVLSPKALRSTHTHREHAMIDYAANLAIFLTERKGSCLARWSGRLTASEQRALFGRFIGKGMLYIDGTTETVEHWVKTGFGFDADSTACISWGKL